MLPFLTTRVAVTSLIHNGTKKLKAVNLANKKIQSEKTFNIICPKKPIFGQQNKYIFLLKFNRNSKTYITLDFKKFCIVSKLHCDAMMHVLKDFINLKYSELLAEEISKSN